MSYNRALILVGVRALTITCIKVLQGGYSIGIPPPSHCVTAVRSAEGHWVLDQVRAAPEWMANRNLNYVWG